MVIRYILATIIVSLTCITAFAQPSTDPAVIATAASLVGAYKGASGCAECDSIITILSLASDGKSDGGRYKITKTEMYHDATKSVSYKKTGEWYMLPNKAGGNTNIIVVDIDDRLETYPLYLVQQDGNLLELNQRSKERFPKYIFKDSTDHELYIAKKGGKPLPLKKTLHYKDASKGFIDPTIGHIMIKQ